MKNSLWETVTKENPCPICGKGDWCIRATSGEVAICYRTESPYMARSGSGWIHRLRDSDDWAKRRYAVGGIPPGVGIQVSPNSAYAEGVCVPKLDFARLHASFFNDEHLIDGFACELGVEGAALRALDVRYNPFDKCWSFPMWDAEGKIVGLRYREFGGSRKWSARGSHDGLFYSSSLIRDTNWAERRYAVGGIPPGVGIQVSHNSACPEGTCVKNLFITEGASDTAAALSLGLAAIGRSSCSSGAALLKELLARLRPSSLAIIADNDAPGLAGARALSQELGATRILTPPEGCKDLREWYKSKNVPWNIARSSKVPHGEIC